MILPEKKTAATDRTNREICDANGWKVGDRLLLEASGIRVAITAIGLWHVLVALLSPGTGEPMPDGEMEMNLWIDGWRKIDPDKPKLTYQVFINKKEHWMDFGATAHACATCLATVALGELVRNEDLMPPNVRPITPDEVRRIYERSDDISDSK